MIPVEYKDPKFMRPAFRHTKRIIVERQTQYPDFNKAKQTPLYPPYYNAGTYGQNGNDIYTRENHILTGASMTTARIPMI